MHFGKINIEFVDESGRVESFLKFIMDFLDDGSLFTRCCHKKKNDVAIGNLNHH